MSVQLKTHLFTTRNLTIFSNAFIILFGHTFQILKHMASNPGSNGNGQYYRRPIYTPQNSSSSLPPASELLSPSPALPYPNKVRHALHSVASPNLGPPSPYLGTHNTYQTLAEPGTPAFLNPSSVDPVSFKTHFVVF